MRCGTMDDIRKGSKVDRRPAMRTLRQRGFATRPLHEHAAVAIADSSVYAYAIS